MSKTSLFDLGPERLNRLLSIGKEKLDAGDDSQAESSKLTSGEKSPAEKPGSWIGRYKVIRMLGEGGMGVIYLAEQEHPIKRRVALKVIKPGMDSKRIITRFEAERQALALLDHPNIAHVFDAGTTEAGRPYFVMEYVKGLSITEHCDHHKLTIEQRLRLFQQVCQAVQHAHQKGIIHRDIKPSNILVSTQDDKAVPKVIDFGVAKALSQPLTERTLATEDSQLIGTPEYMSPEQADMVTEDIDTRSDIYSLGVLLYVLLTGVLPFDSTTFREGGIEHIRQVIREQNPKTPSTRLSSLTEKAEKVAESRQTDVATLAKRLHRELEWIPLKAMRKERTCRYRSAAEFADDIQNYLKGVPLIAGPESAVYRVNKFLRRNKGIFTGLTAVASVLVLGALVSTWQAIIATRAKQAENRLRQQAQTNELDMRRIAYASDMNLAAQALSDNNLGRARYLLNRHRPSASHLHLTDSDDLRGWEWRYLWQQCRSDALYELCQRTGAITSLSVSHDGRLLAIGESEGGGVSIWNLVTREELTTFLSYEREARVAFSPRDRLLAFSTIPSVDSEVSPLPDYNQCYIRLWDGKTEQIIRKLPLAGSCVDLEFSEDGRSLVSLSQDISGSNREKMNKITVWSIPDGKRLASFPARSHIVNSEPLVISPDKTFAVYVARDFGSICLIDLVTGQERRIATTSNGVTTLAVSKDGRILATSEGLNESAIRLWDAESGIEIGRMGGHRSWICDLHFHPDGKTLMSASADQTIRVWDVSNLPNGKLLRTFRGHATEVPRIVLLPDNRT
ncbi:MAG: protein kinase domain-containing protein, partial [Planctomycetota bacterium]